MFDFLSRTKAMLGEEALSRLEQCHVLLFGLGGVGGHAAETLVRSGIGEISLVDSECFEKSNCNRQLFATEETIGMAKVEAAKHRLRSINPHLKIHCYPIFYDFHSDDSLLFSGVDYVIDAIDSVSSKLLLVEKTAALGIPLISCMGTGNKLDPTSFRVSDIYQTKVCPLARVMRSECRKRGIHALKVVYSEEEPATCIFPSKENRGPASVSFVPGVIPLKRIWKPLCAK